MRKLRKAREGIDVQKLVKGDVKKKRKRPKESEEDVGGLRKGSTSKEVLEVFYQEIGIRLIACVWV